MCSFNRLRKESFLCAVSIKAIYIQMKLCMLTDDALLELDSKGFTVETCKLGIDRIHLILFRFPCLLTLLTKEWLVSKKQLTMVSIIERNTTRVQRLDVVVAMDFAIMKLLVEVMLDVEVSILSKYATQ